jgi:GMP synthase-like glutamine amidotransferase
LRWRGALNVAWRTGICFGHQIVARALGGRCVPNGDKWEVGPTPISLTTLGKEVFGVDSLVRLPLLLQLVLTLMGHTQYIEEMHRDHVPELPLTFHLLGSTDVSINQGMVRFNSTTIPPSSPVSLSDIHILTVQGHPEFNEPIVSILVDTRSKGGLIDDATAADARRRANWQNDGVGVVAKAILKVFGVISP